MKRLLFSILLTLTATAIFAQARYVFYFIGDGMGMGHVNAAQTYLRDVKGDTSGLLMTRFPVASPVMTYSASHPITDSAAAGTALSTGTKTKNGMIGMNTDTLNINSIATDFMNHGFAVGVASSVAADDATPAAFYGHAPNRKYYKLLASQAPTSGLNFLAGPVWRGSREYDEGVSGWIAEMKANGFQVYEGFEQYPDAPSTGKSVLLSANPQGDQAGYTIDSIPGALTLPQITTACLRQLQAADENGFFMMIEGGNIDWAAHANDGGAVIKEIINFQEAIDIAYKFYLEHPQETLIVITADHDTGGMALGRNDNQREMRLWLADFQKISKDRFSDYCKERLYEGRNFTWPEMQDFLKANLGFFDVVKLKDADIEALKEAFDITFVRQQGVDVETLYNNFNQFAVKVFDIFNREMGIGWTTGYHTGNMVPVYAIGANADLFNHQLNNIEIPALILEAAGIPRARLE